MRVAQAGGLHDLLAGLYQRWGQERQCGRWMLAGADSIDDLGLLRHGGMRS